MRLQPSIGVPAPNTQGEDHLLSTVKGEKIVLYAQLALMLRDGTYHREIATDRDEWAPAENMLKILNQL